jgi:sulfur-oxidizing protein SoxY
MTAAVGAGCLLPFNLLAATWNKAAFGAKSAVDAGHALGIQSAIYSSEISIVAPDRAENGAVVQVEVISAIPDTEAIALMVEKNPVPLIANFIFSSGVRPYVVTRIKMAETDDIQVIVKSGQQYFTARRRVEVFENGCGT